MIFRCSYIVSMQYIWQSLFKDNISMRLRRNSYACTRQKYRYIETETEPHSAWFLVRVYNNLTLILQASKSVIMRNKHCFLYLHWTRIYEWNGKRDFDTILGGEKLIWLTQRVLFPEQVFVKRMTVFQSISLPCQITLHSTLRKQFLHNVFFIPVWLIG